jgi:NAD-dependent dihydropyrimidine dehydrogenase PreA subunit
LKLKLVYPTGKVPRPVLSQVVLDTKVMLNILEAKVTPTTGEVTVDVPVRGTQLEKIISLFEKEGVHVDRILAPVRIDPDKCISCGACVSPCPVQAIIQKANWDVELDEAKCIKCLLCVDTCPVRAISAG